MVQYRPNRGESQRRGHFGTSRSEDVSAYHSALFSMFYSSFSRLHNLSRELDGEWPTDLCDAPLLVRTKTIALQLAVTLVGAKFYGPDTVFGHPPKPIDGRHLVPPPVTVPRAFLQRP
jgi:hypothetical protein